VAWQRAFSSQAADRLQSDTEPVLTLLPGVNRVHAAPGEVPCISLAASPDFTHKSLASQVTDDGRPVFLAEPLHSAGGFARMVVSCARNAVLRVNGSLAPRIVVVRERDAIQFNGCAPVYLAVYSTPPIGEVPQSAVGKECPVCRVPFIPGARVYVCTCGAVLHCEDDKGDDGLQCALMTSGGCMVCKHPLILKAGYANLPEEEDHD